MVALSVKQLGLTLLGGVGALAMFAAPLAFGVNVLVAAFLAGLPLLLIGFGLGPVAGAIAAAFATLACAIALGPFAAALFAVAFAIPLVIAEFVIMRSEPSVTGGVEWAPPIIVLVWVAIIAAVVMLTGASTLTENPGGIGETVRAFLDSLVGAALPRMGIYRREGLTEFLLPIFPGLALATWLLALAAATAAAFAILRPLDLSRRPTPAMAEQRAPWWLTVLLLGALGAALAENETYSYLGRNAALALMVPPVVSGLGSAHALAGTGRARRPMLITLYLATVIVSPLAITDQLFRLRPVAAGRREV